MKTLRVLYRAIPGWTDSNTAFEVRLIELLCAHLGMVPDWEEAHTVSEIFDRIQGAHPEEAILGVGALVHTSSNERLLDQPIDHARVPDYVFLKRGPFKWIGNALSSLVRSSQFRWILVAFFLSGILPSFCITALERTNSESPFFNAPLWWTPLYYGFVTASTVGYGDLSPKSWAAQAMSIVILVGGTTCMIALIQLMIVAFRTAFRTTTLNPQELIQGGNFRIGYVFGSTAHLSLSGVSGSQLIQYPDHQSLMEAMKRPRGIDAVLVDPVFGMHVIDKYRVPFQIGSPLTMKHRYGVVLPEGCHFEEQLRISLLDLEASGAIDGLHSLVLPGL
jgi:hypothetical protein